MNPSNSADQKNNPNRANGAGVSEKNTSEPIMSHKSEPMQSTEQSAQSIDPKTNAEIQESIDRAVEASKTKSSTEYMIERDKVRGWLDALGLPALPVAPAQDVEKYHTIKDGKKVPLFTGKNPSYLDRNGVPHIVNHGRYKNALPTKQDSQFWWLNPANGIGTLGGWGDIIWLDPDRKDFDSQEEIDHWFYGLLEAHPHLLDSWWEKTQSFGYRLALKVKQKPDFTEFALEAGGKKRGEAIGEGRFTVLAPTIGVSGNPYRSMNRAVPVEIESLDSIGIFPKSARKQGDRPNVERKPRPQSAANTGTIALADLGSSETAGRVLAGEDICGDRSNSLTTAIREWFGWESWATEQGVSYSGSTEDLAHEAGVALGLDGDRVDRILKTINPTDCHPAALHVGGEESCWKKIARLDRASFEALAPQSVRDVVLPPRKQKAQGNSQQEKQVEGEQIACTLARHIKRLKENWGDRLKFNKLSKRIEFDGEPISIDTIYLKIAVDLDIEMKKGTATDVVMDIAMQNAYHPVEVYLRHVHEQYRPDTSILENVADHYFGTSNPLYNAYIKRMMIGAVARVMQPGCKLDTALILQGSQGIGKSSFFKALAGEQWFDDSLGNVSDKDERLKLHSVWISEWAELDSIFKRKDISATKAFLSTSTDNLRVPYGRSVEPFPRQSIIVGTANPSELLSDPTGSRRFWVIPVQQRIDLKRLEAERDRLWSAAVELYQRGEQWHLTELEAAASEKANQDFEMIDSWETYIRNYLAAGKDWATTSEILQQALEIEIGRHDRASQMRAADILKRLGWQQKTKTIGGDRVRGWELTQPTQPQNEVVPRLCHPETIDQQALQPSTQPATTSRQTFSNETSKGDRVTSPDVEPEDSAQENKKLPKRLCQVVQVVTPQSQSGFQGDTTSDTTSVGCVDAEVQEFISLLPNCQRYEDIEDLKARFSLSVVSAAWLEVKGTPEGDRVKALKRAAGKAKDSKSVRPIA